MAKDKGQPVAKTGKAAREARLAAELRANLKRRKAASRSRSASEKGPPAGGGDEA